MLTRNCLEDPQTSGVTPSSQDKEYWLSLRKFVEEFLSSSASTYAPLAKPGSLLLEIGPQTYTASHPFSIHSHSNITIQSLDIVPGATYCADLTKDNSSSIPDNTFDYIICTEVIEHTLQPFLAVKELHRMLKPNGLLFFSVPCNFRIHGPLPDCWRFTQHGLQQSLFSSTHWSWISLTALDDPDRPLFPIDYAGVVRKL
jgi:SAM-dependent methyltransferase